MASPEAKFTHQARKGVNFWRQQRMYALATAVMFAAGSAWQLYRTWKSPSADALTDVYTVLCLVSAAVAAGAWQVHAEIMQGAAQFVQRQTSKP